MKKLAIMAVSVSALALAACSTIEEKPATNMNMAPAERATVDVGETIKIKSLRNGQEGITTVTKSDAQTFTWAASNGCHGTSIADDRFAPSLTWNNCGSGEWGSGTDEITSKKGELWPLQVAHKVSYVYTATSSAGRKSDNYRDCKVSAAVNIMAAGKAYDAFKVECDEKYRSRVYYYAPSLNRVVLETNYHKQRNTMEVTEFVADVK